MVDQEEEDLSGQPVWQSVIFFCCKGVIEGVVVLLFIWLLVQVLFPKHLEDLLRSLPLDRQTPSSDMMHLQVLLGVGLAVFCFCLILGCVLCWRRGRPRPLRDKEAAMSLPPPPAADPVKRQYEELAGDVLGPPSPSRPRPESCFPLRRLSTPAGSCLPHPCRTSRPGLVSKTRRALERRRTVTGDSFLYGERGGLTGPAPEGPRRYGYGAIPDEPPPPARLRFTLCFSPARGTLAVSVLGLQGGGASRRLGGASVRLALPPLCPAPLQASGRRRSLSPELQSQSFALRVGSVERLRACTLWLAVFTRDFPGLREAPLGHLELPCGEIDWEPDHAIAFTKELQPAKDKLRKSLSFQDALGQRGPVWTPRALGQLFVLLQYQTQAHRMKVMVRKAENLTKLTRMPGTPDHCVVINLRHEGVVIGTKQTKGAGGRNAVWNAPFLFDLPHGDVTELHLVLEFIVMQGRIYTKSSVLGHVLIGCEAPETGQTHWRDMCGRGQVETTRWHTIQPDLP